MKLEFMKRALDLAKKGQGFTSPNPCVGAVIVKSGKIVAEGYHKGAGMDHAEIVAIKALREKIKGAELYVTLEPCSHVGKTGACANAIVEAGFFRKVYVGMVDPFKKVNGRGIAILRNAGIEVEVLGDEEDLARDIRDLNQAFIKSVVNDLPYVILKAGISLDGRIATKNGESKWITGEAARSDSRLERSFCDAVLVGSGTVLADNPELGPHGKWAKKNLLRVVLDSELKLSPELKVFRDGNAFVACSDLASSKRKIEFEKTGVKFKSFGRTKVDLKKLLKYLNEKFKVQSVFVEGGASVHGSFYDLGLVDEVLFYIAPRLIGGEKSLSVLGANGVENLKDADLIEDYELSVIDSDIKFKGRYRLY